MRMSRFLAAIVSTVALAGGAAAEPPAPGAGSLAIPKIVVLNPSHAAPAPAAPAAAAPAATTAPAPAAPEAKAAAAPPRAPAGLSDDDLLDPTQGTGEPPPASATAPAPPSAEPGTEAAAPPPPPEPTLAIDIDLTSQRMTVAEHGVVKYTWPVSTARYGYRTPTGTFQPTWMAKMWYSRQYDYARMPNAIFFHKGTAIHATNEVRLLGRPASHGCVRLALKNSATLYRLVTQHGKELTKIEVHGSPGHPNQEIAGYDRYDNDYYRSVYGAPRTQRRYPYDYGYGGYYAPPPRGYYPYGARPRYVQRGFNGGYRYGYGF